MNFVTQAFLFDFWTSLPWKLGQINRLLGFLRTRAYTHTFFYLFIHLLSLSDVIGVLLFRLRKRKMTVHNHFFLHFLLCYILCVSSARGKSLVIYCCTFIVSYSKWKLYTITIILLLFVLSFYCCCHTYAIKSFFVHCDNKIYERAANLYIEWTLIKIVLFYYFCLLYVVGANNDPEK